MSSDNITSGTIGDRFITSRSAMNLKVSQYNLSKENDSSTISGNTQRQVTGSLSESLFSTSSVDECKILACRTKAPEPKAGYENRLSVLYSQNLAQKVQKPSRHIPTVANRILDAPDMLDDYYLNLLDWSKSNKLAIALGSAVYIWSAESGDIVSLYDEPGINITSLSWSVGGQYLSICNDDCNVQLWDVSASKRIRIMAGHTSRVSALSWNDSILSSAGRDSVIMNHDVRCRDHLSSTFNGHTQEICGLSWSPDGTQLASGGNDNLMNIWNHQSGKLEYSMTQHGAAVKALAWSPTSPKLLASGSGTADPSIRFWNTSSGSLLNTINTGAQVCALQWSHHYKEIVSSHGWRNTICVWNYPSMVKTAELTGHTSRVLHLAQSPDGTTLASAAGDETLRFWPIWSRTNTLTDPQTKTYLNNSNVNCIR